MGVINVNNVDYKLLLRLAFKKGNATAQFELAMKYKEGIDVQQDMSIARELLLMAARRKHHKAIWITAYNYQSGEWGFPVDMVKSTYWNGQLIINLSQDIDKTKKYAQKLSGDIQDHRNILAFATK